MAPSGSSWSNVIHAYSHSCESVSGSSRSVRPRSGQRTPRHCEYATTSNASANLALASSTMNSIRDGQSSREFPRLAKSTTPPGENRVLRTRMFIEHGRSGSCRPIGAKPGRRGNRFNQDLVLKSGQDIVETPQGPPDTRERLNVRGEYVAVLRFLARLARIRYTTREGPFVLPVIPPPFTASPISDRNN